MGPLTRELGSLTTVLIAAAALALGVGCGAAVEPGRDVVVVVEQASLTVDAAPVEALSIFVSAVSLIPCPLAGDASQSAALAHGVADFEASPRAALRWVELVGTDASPIAVLSTPQTQYCRAQLTVFPSEQGPSLRATVDGADAFVTSTMAFEVDVPIADPFEAVGIGAVAIGTHGRSVTLRIAVDPAAFDESLNAQNDELSARLAAALSSSLRLTLESPAL